MKTYGEIFEITKFTEKWYLIKIVKFRNCKFSLKFSVEISVKETIPRAVQDCKEQHKGSTTLYNLAASLKYNLLNFTIFKYQFSQKFFRKFPCISVLASL